MKIAEMEAHHGSFLGLENEIKAMVDDFQFPVVFSRCEDTFPHVVPALNFRKKRDIEPLTPRILCFDVVCRYAPLLFEHSIIESLAKFVRSTRLLKTHENGYVDMADTALSHEEAARTLWNRIERQPGFMQRNIRKETNIEQDVSVNIVATWEKFGLILRTPDSGSYVLQLRTQLDGITEGLCQSCEVRGEGRKERLFKPVSCGKCGIEDYFFINYPQ